MSALNKIALIAAGLLVFETGFAQDPNQPGGDPPWRVARLNYIQGNVSMQPVGADDWSPAEINRPFTTGGYLYTDTGAVAELHTDVAVMRMGQLTSFGFLNLDDQTVQIQLSEGAMYFRVRNFGPGQIFEVDTPNAAITFLQNGLYRVDVDPNGNGSFVVVRQGTAEITGGGQAFTLVQGNSASLSGTDQLAYDVEMAPDPDGFDGWCQQRDAHEARLASARYVNPNLIGYEDLDDYGQWQQAPQYGAIWYPSSVPAGWAPYHVGYWAWVAPWGYTWVDSSPWGFAPFHYGRWVYYGNRWGWSPGPPVVVGGPVVRPYYAPALVTFFGGAQFGVGISIGGGFAAGASLGWVALGWGEVYAPPYHVSQNYFQTVNVTSTVIVRNVNITNVYNNVYIQHNTTIINNYQNLNAPGGFNGMPRTAFASGQSVSRAGFVVPPAQAVRLAATGGPVVGIPVAPTRQAVAPIAAASHGRVSRPPQAVMARQVVARVAPPPRPASFAATQQYLSQHAGQPLNATAMHQQIQQSNPAAFQHPAVHTVAPVARPTVVQAGARVGNPVPFRPSGAGQVSTQPQRPNAPRPIAPAPNTSGVPATQRPSAAPPVTNQPPRNVNRPPENQPIPQHPQTSERPIPQQPTPQNQPQTPQRPAQPEARPQESPRPQTQQPPPQRQPTYQRPAQPEARPQEAPRPQTQPQTQHPQATPPPQRTETRAAPHEQPHTPPNTSTTHKDEKKKDEKRTDHQ